jgi:hypothetical protein
MRTLIATYGSFLFTVSTVPWEPRGEIPLGHPTLFGFVLCRG